MIATLLAEHVLFANVISGRTFRKSSTECAWNCCWNFLKYVVIYFYIFSLWQKYRKNGSLTFFFFEEIKFWTTGAIQMFVSSWSYKLRVWSFKVSLSLWNGIGLSKWDNVLRIYSMQWTNSLCLYIVRLKKKKNINSDLINSHFYRYFLQNPLSPPYIPTGTRRLEQWKIKFRCLKRLPNPQTLT